jgi:hypothetical protein
MCLGHSVCIPWGIWGNTHPHTHQYTNTHIVGVVLVMHQHISTQGILMKGLPMGPQFHYSNISDMILSLWTNIIPSLLQSLFLCNIRKLTGYHYIL